MTGKVQEICCVKVKERSTKFVEKRNVEVNLMNENIIESTER